MMPLKIVLERLRFRRVIAMPFIAIALCASGCQAPQPTTETDAKSANGPPVVREWNELIPPGDVPMRRTFFRPRSIGSDLGADAIDTTSDGTASDFRGGGIDHSSSQRADQFGSFNTIAELDGRNATLSGYTVPISFDDQGKVTDLFLVPFFGACIHVPPPPPNQMVYVHLAHPIAATDPWDAFELTGVLHVARFDAQVASAAYSMNDPQIRPKS